VWVSGRVPDFAEVKGRIKARMREMARRRMLAAVPKADLVVMNPTHYAVALKYDEARDGRAAVVAKGADLLALRIRDLAREHAVPVLQAPPLARALYAHTELDQRSRPRCSPPWPRCWPMSTSCAAAMAGRPLPTRRPTRRAARASTRTRPAPQPAATLRRPAHERN
jgi:flagellar biosynthetic protein FlhB